MVAFWWRVEDSNSGPADYESAFGPDHKHLSGSIPLDAYQLIENLAAALASAYRSILIYVIGPHIAAITRHRPAQQSPLAPATASAS